MIPSKVTQQAVLAGRVLRDLQELVTACTVSHSRDAPFGSQGFPPFAQRLWGCNGGFRSRSAVMGACGAPRRVPGRRVPCSSARPRLPNSSVFSPSCKKATLRKSLSPQRTWVHRGACAPRILTLTVTGGPQGAGGFTDRYLRVLVYRRRFLGLGSAPVPALRPVAGVRGPYDGSSGMRPGEHRTTAEAPPVGPACPARGPEQLAVQINTF